MIGLGNDLLHEARRRSGLSRTEVAARADATEAEVTAWEEGRSAPSFDEVIRVLRLMQLDLDMMLVDYDDADWSYAAQRLSLTPSERFEVHERWAASVLEMRDQAGIVASEPKLRSLEILQSLADSAIEFVLAGDYAAIIHGSPFMTQRIELALGDAAENTRRFQAVASTFSEFERSRLIVIDAAFLELSEGASDESIAGASLRVAALADVVRMKQVANQSLDQRVLPTLREILASRNPRNRSDG